MPDLDNAHPIDGSDLLARRGDVEFRLENVWLDGKRNNLFGLVRQLDPGDTKLMGILETETLRTLREALSLYLVLFDMVAERSGYAVMLEQTDERDEASFRRLRTFLTSWGLFAASSYLVSKLAQRLEGETAPQLNLQFEPDLFEAMFSRDRDEALKLLLAEYTSLITNPDRSGHKPSSGAELAWITRDFFDALRDQALKKRPAFGKLLEHVEGEAFRVGDMTIVGFMRLDTPAAPRLEFTPLEPQEIVGNDQAKLKVRRSIERLALFDPERGQNPVCALGGLNWSVLWDGPPGTGKTSLMRLAMTLCARFAGRVGFGAEFMTVDPSIKDEYYGRTAKNLRERFERTRTTRGLFLVFFDDIDLLLLPRDASHISGSDKDILNLTMQYLDGVHTVFRGNGQVYAATNSPLSTESALRQRFHDRLEVRGPEGPGHYTQLLRLKLGRLADAGLVKLREVAGRSESPRVRAHPAARAGRDSLSWEEIGHELAALQRDDERLSGRALHAISETLKERAADFDIPDEFFDKPESFRGQPWEKRLDLLAQHYTPITAEMILEETQRYLENERRYEVDRTRNETERHLDAMIHQYEARLLFEERRATRPSAADGGQQ